MPRRVRIKDHRAEQRIFTLRGVVAGVIVGVLLLTVAAQLLYLTVLKHAYYAELSQGNRALRGAYPPGSTVKPLFALAALKYGVMTPDQTIFCPGHFSLPGSSHVFRDWKPRGHGTVANKLGIDRMHDFMTTFGFGEITEIDIPGEKPGLMPSTEWKRHAYKRPAEQVWFPGETISVGIGQGYMLATPMQLAHAVSGTAAAATAGAPYKIGGKTGSAQVFTIGQNEKYNEKQLSERMLDHALFISFAPAEDPQLAVAVFVENGKHRGSTAAPIARKIFDAFLLPDKSHAAG